MRVLTDEKRDSILQAAAEVFQEVGFEGASMALISARAGGSKSTLYRYFSSKEDLFVAVLHEHGKRLILPGIEQLINSESPDLVRLLCRFGEQTLGVLCDESSIKMFRMVIAESGRSDVGLRFLEAGPKLGLEALALFFKKKMDLGLLRQVDPIVAARHYMALLESETVLPNLLGARLHLKGKDVRDAVKRAVETFLCGYANS